MWSSCWQSCSWPFCDLVLPPGSKWPGFSVVNFAFDCFVALFCLQFVSDWIFLLSLLLLTILWPCFAFRECVVWSFCCQSCSWLFCGLNLSLVCKWSGLTAAHPAPDHFVALFCQLFQDVSLINILQSLLIDHFYFSLVGMCSPATIIVLLTICGEILFSGGMCTITNEEWYLTLLVELCALQKVYCSFLGHYHVILTPFLDCQISDCM